MGKSIQKTETKTWSLHPAVPARSAADACASQVACLESKLKSNAKVFEACNA